VAAKAEQHDADRGFDGTRNMFGNGLAKRQGRTRKSEQGQRVAQAPGQPVPDDIGDVAPPRGDARDRSDMIGLKRMLHAQDKSKPQNSKHASARP